MEIPYTVDARPDTGLTNPKLGIWLFLASEVMLFGSLFSSYVLLRSGAEFWPVQRDILNVPLATLNTIILISSSVTMVLSWAALKMHNLAHFKRYMGLTFLCGLGFMVVKSFEYASKFQHVPPLLPSSSNFIGIYFLLTGLHGTHVAIGVLWLLSLWVLALRGRLDAADAVKVEIAGLYWHFVDVVWIAIFTLVYLIP